MKKIIFFIFLASISIFIYINYNSKENVYEPIKEYQSFPPKEYLEELDKMQVQ